MGKNTAKKWGNHVHFTPYLKNKIQVGANLKKKSRGANLKSHIN
jgi:hypothetical protein